MARIIVLFGPKEEYAAEFELSRADGVTLRERYIKPPTIDPKLFDYEERWRMLDRPRLGSQDAAASRVLQSLADVLWAYEHPEEA